MKTLIINGCTFEVYKPRKNKVTLNQAIDYLERYQHRDIWDCYDKPSTTKVSIYNEWLQWYTEQGNEIDYFCVTSYNCMQFSLGALYFDNNTNTFYILSITASHNTATVIDGVTTYTFND